MARTVERVQFKKAKCPDVIRVAAYARVSSAKDAMHHSLSAQVSYYSSLIQKTPGWLYCGVYADEALTGTKEDRASFQKLLSECKAGNIDMVITKSISRFARNTVTLLETVRELKELGVDVYFEEQNIHSKSASGELMLTVLASFAQAESLSASENQKWRIKHNFENGVPWCGAMLGYRYKNGRYMVVPAEANIVRFIFNKYLEGNGVTAIINELNDKGILTRTGFPWCKTGVRTVLTNYTYTGNLLLQKKYRENHITKKTLVNHGELAMYHAENTHEAIIDISLFNRVQKEMERRKAQFNTGEKSRERYPFSGIIKCGCCGASYRRKNTSARVVWICNTYNTKGKKECPFSKQIPEETLKIVVSNALGYPVFDEVRFKDEVANIVAYAANSLRIVKKDGETIETVWLGPSRKESWTPEKKKLAKERKERKNANSNRNPCND